VIALSAVAVAAIVGSAVAAAQTGPQLTVTPPTGLADGDSVRVLAEGLEPGSTVFVGIVNPDPSLGEGLARVVLLPEGDPRATSGFRVDPAGFLDIAVEVVAGQVGTNARSQCPPTAAQQSRGFTYCRLFVSSVDQGGDTVQVDIAYGDQPSPGTSSGTTTTMTPLPTTSPPPASTTSAPAPGSLASTGDATPALAVVACGLLGLGIIAVNLHDGRASHRPAHRRHRR
jgi:hypothetical protein